MGLPTRSRHMTDSINNLSVDTGDSLGFNDSNDLTISGTSIVNSGNIGLISTGSTTQLLIDAADVTLSGSGTVTLSNNAHNIICGLLNSNRLTNAAGHTIQGAGKIGKSQMALTNQGLIDANQSVTGAINTGVMQAGGGGTLQQMSDFFTTPLLVC